jgi:NAD-dependent SIR2 family protein deacetylase
MQLCRTITMKTAPVDLAGLARLILSPACKSIAFLTGAGVSVAADIPDFRSPGGLYDTLRPELITASRKEQDLMKLDPTYVVSWDIFQQNAFPYLEVRRPFILGTRNHKWKATIAHRFMELVHTKTNKLTRVFTQNIDGLDRQCEEIPSEKIVGVHGTLSKAACEGCGQEADFDEFCDTVQSNIKDIYKQDESAPVESTPILCKSCHKPLVKPTTVLFGRSLPQTFFECVQNDLPQIDLLIVAGTSLVVYPANTLVERVPENTIRVIVNRDPVGQQLGIQYGEDAVRDLFFQGNCDDVFLELTEHLGWLDDINAKIDLLPTKSAELVREKMSES